MNVGCITLQKIIQVRFLHKSSVISTLGEILVAWAWQDFFLDLELQKQLIQRFLHLIISLVLIFAVIKSLSRHFKLFKPEPVVAPRS